MKFRQRLLLFGVTVAALTAAAIFLAGGTLIRRSVGDRVKERLGNDVIFLAEILARDPDLLPPPGGRSADGPPGSGLAGTFARNPDVLADAAGRALGLRVTIVGADGTVVGDSSLDGEELAREDNHARSPGNRGGAARTGPASSERWSDTVHDTLHYLARRVDRRRPNRRVSSVWRSP